MYSRRTGLPKGIRWFVHWSQLLCSLRVWETAGWQSISSGKQGSWRVLLEDACVLRTCTAQSAEQEWTRLPVMQLVKWCAGADA